MDLRGCDPGPSRHAECARPGPRARPAGKPVQGLRSAEDDLARINDAARLPLPRVQVNRNLRLPRAGGVDEVLGYVARDAVELLGSSQLDRVKECSNPECTRLFVELSRSGARRWCGMAECGNKYKSASYRQRRKATYLSTSTCRFWMTPARISSKAPTEVFRGGAARRIAAPPRPSLRLRQLGQRGQLGRLRLADQRARDSVALGVGDTGSEQHHYT
ncbi:hypothetical protein EWH70_26610 [Amycolatopsis suaedae]|uniref:Zinc finger CGNR domain-containing protein n=1 Tax=Amycolatopsis suaedae TaxID=2510978 RepID=A0A4V2ELC0_9PSEU|nr:hypothetical protein EWH70_26610 [Amycolatopsis suaedae]